MRRVANNGGCGLRVCANQTPCNNLQGVFAHVRRRKCGRLLAVHISDSIHSTYRGTPRFGGTKKQKIDNKIVVRVITKQCRHTECQKKNTVAPLHRHEHAAHSLQRTVHESGGISCSSGTRSKVSAMRVLA